MSQPLGRAVGNALEVAEALDTLEGDGPPELHGVRDGSGLAHRVAWRRMGARGRADVEDALRSGRGLHVFRRMVEAQGGDAAGVRRSCASAARAPPTRAGCRQGRLHRASRRADRRACVYRVWALAASARAIRSTWRSASSCEAKVGDRVVRGQPLATLHANDETRARAAEGVLRSAIDVSAAAVVPPPLILERISG